MLDFKSENHESIAPNTLVGASQLEMELLYSKYQLLPTIREYFETEEAPESLESCGIPIGFGMDLLVQMVLHKRATVSTLVGILRKHFENEEYPAQVCADWIAVAIEQDIADWNDLAQQVIILHDIPRQLRKKIDQYQYPLPMIVAPESVTNNKQSGYMTIRGSMILRNNHHEDDICLDHINRVNAQPLALNQDVVAFLQNSWKNLDNKKPDETFQDYERRKRAFQNYDTTSREVIDALAVQGNRFFLTHKYDKRGRVYSQGYHVNYQGNDWNKACIEFADAEVLSDA